MSTGDEDNDCVLPPSQPLPPELLGQYTVDHDPHEEAEIARYVDIECRGEETVRHVERIRTEFVFAQRYDVWDVHTDKQRWWVITNLTNLYPQQYFQSLDVTLSFHIGLMQRMSSRGNNDREPDPFEELYRRRDEAAELIEKSIEPEENQAAAMRLRECLITLVAVVRRRAKVPLRDDSPKDADFVAWSDLLISHFCPGGRNKTLRQYLKTVAQRTWQLVNWLTHDRDATKTAATIAHESVSTLIGHYIGLVVQDRVDLSSQCPRCSSRDVRSYYDHTIVPDGDYYQRCKACDWSDHPNRDVRD